MRLYGGNMAAVRQGMFLRGIGKTADGGVMPPLKHII